MIARLLPWRLALWTLGTAPLPIAMLLGHLYLGLARLFAPALERRARENLARAGMDARGVVRRGRRSLVRFMVVLTRFNGLSRANCSRWIRIEGWEHLRAAAGRGHGVLVISVHVGHWELGALAAGLAGHPSRLLVHRSPHREMEAYLEKLRTLSGNRLIENRGAAWAVVSALKKNQTVTTLIDTAPSWASADVEVPFLGSEIRTTTSLARLAYLTGAAMVPSSVLWSEAERRYVLRFEQPLASSGDHAQDTRRLFASLERVVREYPDQYFWIFDPGWAGAK
jgi:KDO2-lipid IV(A) lauroyltransferase